MTEEKTQRERNQDILNSYDGSDIMHPQVILRKVKQVDGDILDDGLFGVKLSCYRVYDAYEIMDRLPEEYQWASRSIADFMDEYTKLLEHPTERIQLEALAKSGCRIFIEDKCSSTDGNGKSAGYSGQSSHNIAGKPAIKLVAYRFGNRTFLHEAIHNSDLRLCWSYFTKQKIYQAAIMMLDAQKIQSSHGYQSVKKLRHINEVYQAGEIYTEGLAWIGSMSMEELAHEKNHIGKNLKVLHSLYTEALLKEQGAVLDCFRFWQPSAHIGKLLETYNANGQKIGKERDKILKQQKHLWDEMMKFRKEINKLKVNGLESKTLSLWGGSYYYCQTGGVKSLFPLYMAQDKADKAFQQIEDDEKLSPNTKKRRHTAVLKALFKEIKAGDLNVPSLFAEKFLTCKEYLYKMRKYYPSYDYNDMLFDLSPKENEPKGIAGRKRLYDNLEAQANILYMQMHSVYNLKECALAYLYKAYHESVRSGDEMVKMAMMSNTSSLEHKREYVKDLITRAREKTSRRMTGRYAAEAFMGMEYLLQKYNLSRNTHGVLEADDLRNFYTSEKVVDDLKWFKTKENADGLSLETYKCFDAGIVSDYCSRPASAFKAESGDYIPNNYKNQDSQKVAHTRALYEFLALRHAYQAKTHCKKFPQHLQLQAFMPNSDYYRQIRFLAAPQVISAKDSKDNGGK